MNHGFLFQLTAIFPQTIELPIFSEDKTFTCEVLPAIAGAETQSITVDVDVFSKCLLQFKSMMKFAETLTQRFRVRNNAWT